jgi:hypothetical protein
LEDGLGKYLVLWSGIRYYGLRYGVYGLKWER